MFRDDVIYVSLLLSCVAFGVVYRKFKNPHERQWISTSFGLILIILVSGTHVMHPLICLLINAVIVTRLSWKICHLASLFFSFFYLLIIFRLGHLVGMPVPPAHTNLVQMILTLKLSGLAFEINSAAAMKLPDDPQGVNSMALKKISFMDVFHYGLSYMGVLTGPYYRYRTYWDSLHRPFSNYIDPWPLTLYKLKQAAALSILFLIMNYTFPTEYTVSEEYANRSLLYRWLYTYPVFATFRLRLFSGIILSECACQMAGVGGYPTRCETAPGLGPRNYQEFEEICTNKEKITQEPFDFETIHNMNIWQVETCHLVRSCMKYWNSCIQYWMGVYIYKRFPFKPLRIMMTLTLSALWHGYAVGYYVCICSVPFYLQLEDLLIKFHNQHEKDSIGWKIWTFTLWAMRVSCMAYLGVPFLLLDFRQILQFYANLYYLGHISSLILYIVARLLKPYIIKKNAEKNK
ncbi:lysophospholipid acyltransferase 7 [Polistes fuscatus]|uniref:lysophospholipid acyltransferase 7 n=1 Tax=Polistes fuscatus TaxID=30207 RepID=UPI001CA8B265|nr:lysophospholipid acyltransferase 7 [Polistes fuscatus]